MWGGGRGKKRGDAGPSIAPMDFFYSLFITIFLSLSLSSLLYTLLFLRSILHTYVHANRGEEKEGRVVEGRKEGLATNRQKL